MDSRDFAGPDRTPRGKLRKTDRQARILLELTQKPHLRTNLLAERFGVTTETIRRDVEELSRQGKLTRGYGGVTAAQPATHPGLEARKRAHAREHARIGRRAAALLQDGETIMIDAGSTTIQFARELALAGTELVVITNSVHVAMALGQNPATSVIVCPGEYLPREGALIGTDTVEFLARYRVDRCFLGASGLAPAGVTEAVPGFAAVKRAMLQQAQSAHLLVDSSKFGCVHFSTVAGLDAFRSVVTDARPDPELAQTLAAAGTELLLAP